MNEASKTLLLNSVKEWTKFVNERERMRSIATELAAVTQRIVLETVSFLKTQNIDVQCDNVSAMKMMGHPIVIEPVIDAVYPNVKAKVNLTCSGATRSIVINPNGSISAGGNPFMFEQLKKAIPDSFTTNAAEFVSDAFLFVARNQSPDAQAAAQPAAPVQEAPAPPAVAATQPAPSTSAPAQPAPRPAQPTAPSRPAPGAPPAPVRPVPPAASGGPKPPPIPQGPPRKV